MKRLLIKEYKEPDQFVEISDDLFGRLKLYVNPNNKFGLDCADIPEELMEEIYNLPRISNEHDLEILVY